MVNDDGLSLDLSIHAQDLEDFILSQVWKHDLSFLTILLVDSAKRRKEYR